MLKCFLLLLCVVCSLIINAQADNANLEIEPVAKDVFLYRTFSVYKGARISANALYIVTNKGVVLIDSPWDTTQFQPLLDSIQARHGKKVVLCIATHFHEDRTAGLEYFKSRGIATYTTRQTDELSLKRGMKRAEHLIERDTIFRIGQYSFQTYYPGPGHAPDNIVIWLPNQQVLYGGCLVKSTADSTLGNLGDANVHEYSNSINRVIKKYAKARIVIPGHNDWRSDQSLQHTYKLAKDL